MPINTPVSEGGSPQQHHGHEPNYYQLSAFLYFHGHPANTPAEKQAALKYPSDAGHYRMDVPRGENPLKPQYQAQYGKGGPTGRAASPSGGGSASGVVAQVVQFFRGKGLSDAAIAGILGNMRVESSFNTGAYNSGEGAVGLVQWEGGRDDAMRAWASAHGLSSSSVQGQLGYIWHELTTGYSGVLAQLRNASSASQAATIWDSEYERSAGTTRQQRIDSANSFMATGLRTDGGGSGGVGSVPGGGGSAGGGGGMAQPLTRQDYTSVDVGGLGDLGHLLQKIPELRNILSQAQSGNWSIQKFTNAVQDSTWWKQHSQSARAAIIEQANDPAQWREKLTNLTGTIAALAKQLGFTGLGQATLENIATAALMSGNDGNHDWLTQQLGRHTDYTDVKSGADLNGQMAQTYGQLQEMAKSYGIQYSPATLSAWSKQIVLGNNSIDHYQEQFKNLAAGRYPGIADQIRAGATVQQIADPYIQSYANLLELDPNAVSLSTGLIQQALQGRADQTGKTGSQVTGAMPLYQFEKLVRTDPKWQYTTNAKDSFSTALVKIGHDFGFGF